MGVPIAAIGVKIGYKAGASSSAPTSVGWGENKFIAVPDIKSTPDFNPQPNTADATTFDNTEFTTAIELLKDIGGSISFNANLTEALKTAWAAAITACSTNGGVWWAISVPGMTKSITFFGKPSNMGLPALTANALAETAVYITPITEPTWTNNESQGT